MATPVHTPRINNNDDVVTLVAYNVAVGDHVARGQVLAQVETDKAMIDVEAPDAGYILALLGEAKAKIAVGGVMIWMGEKPDEAVPQEPSPSDRSAESSPNDIRPSGRALLLIRKHGLNEADIARTGPRLTVADVERYLAGSSIRTSIAALSPGAAATAFPGPEIQGTLRELRNDERGMLATVAWHRDVAVPGYIEYEYDPEPWNLHAAEFAARNKLLMSPLLALLAWRLGQIACQRPALNATVVDNRRYEYDQINLGFTMQVDATLYLLVARDVGSATEIDFINRLGELQRRASTHNVGYAETTGATVSFSSMSRWKSISRHVPILPPYTSVIVAHTAARDGRAVLGASYDHRVLNGFAVAELLRDLADPRRALSKKVVSP